MGFYEKRIHETSNSNHKRSEKQLAFTPNTSEINIKDSEKWLTEAIPINERGILPGDFNDLISNGVISVDVILDALEEERKKERKSEGQKPVH
ncbi:hypothetical protein CR203_12925 [Salipaludibacillus neizhouensis]|uniref:Uncharacterized protein n=1 Tax=Salipaludibacillus neizhouensis TaxID=885475 RepID=A0A3A9K5R2_9BACI|nr:hypothetical protein [Salipaludibacillus neizhouensis]RKL66738.1 hypothetical protein CR203_12925 [Salipaludibacillus neizhouensis]